MSRLYEGPGLGEPVLTVRQFDQLLNDCIYMLFEYKPGGLQAVTPFAVHILEVPEGHDPELIATEPFISDI